MSEIPNDNLAAGQPLEDESSSDNSWISTSNEMTLDQFISSLHSHKQIADVSVTSISQSPLTSAPVQPQTQTAQSKTCTKIDEFISREIPESALSNERRESPETSVQPAAFINTNSTDSVFQPGLDRNARIENAPPQVTGVDDFRRHASVYNYDCFTRAFEEISSDSEFESDENLEDDPQTLDDDDNDGRVSLNFISKGDVDEPVDESNSPMISMNKAIGPQKNVEKPQRWPNKFHIRDHLNSDELQGYDFSTLPPAPTENQIDNQVEPSQLVRLEDYRVRLMKKIATEQVPKTYATIQFELVVKYGSSKRSYDAIIKNITTLPEVEINRFKREVRGFVAAMKENCGPTEGPNYFGTGIRNLHGCPNYCLAYDGPEYGDITSNSGKPNRRLKKCPRCNSDRFKEIRKDRIPRPVTLMYISFRSHIRSWFFNPLFAEILSQPLPESKTDIADIFDGLYTQASSPSTNNPNNTYKIRRLFFHLGTDDGKIIKSGKHLKFNNVVLVCHNFPKADRAKFAFSPFAFPQKSGQNAHAYLPSFFGAITNDFHQAEYGFVVFNAFTKNLDVIGYTAPSSRHPCPTCKVEQYFTGLPTTSTPLAADSDASIPTALATLTAVRKKKDRDQGISTFLTQQNLSMRTSQEAIEATRNLPLYTDLPPTNKFPRSPIVLKRDQSQNTGVNDKSAFFSEDPNHMIANFMGPESIVLDLMRFAFINDAALIGKFLIPFRQGKNNGQSNDDSVPFRDLRLNERYRENLLNIFRGINDVAGSQWLKKNIDVQAFSEGKFFAISADDKKTFLELFTIIYDVIRPQFENDEKKLHLFDLLLQLTVIIRMSYMSKVPRDILDFYKSTNNLKGTHNFSTFVTQFIQEWEKSFHDATQSLICGIIRETWDCIAEKFVLILKKTDASPYMIESLADGRLGNFVTTIIQPRQNVLTKTGFVLHKRVRHQEQSSTSEISAVSTSSHGDTAADQTTTISVTPTISNSNITPITTTSTSKFDTSLYPPDIRSKIAYFAGSVFGSENGRKDFWVQFRWRYPKFDVPRTQNPKFNFIPDLNLENTEESMLKTHFSELNEPFKMAFREGYTDEFLEAFENLLSDFKKFRGENLKEFVERNINTFNSTFSKAKIESVVAATKNAYVKANNLLTCLNDFGNCSSVTTNSDEPGTLDSNESVILDDANAESTPSGSPSDDEDMDDDDVEASEAIPSFTNPETVFGMSMQEIQTSINRFLSQRTGDVRKYSLQLYEQCQPLSDPKKTVKHGQIIRVKRSFTRSSANKLAIYMRCYVFVKVTFADNKEEECLVVGKFLDLDKSDKLELNSDLKLHDKQKGKLLLGYRSSEFKTLDFFNVISIGQIGNLCFVITPPYASDSLGGFYMMQYLFDPNVFARFEREDGELVDLALYEDEDEIGGSFQQEINKRKMDVSMEETENSRKKCGGNEGGNE